MGETYGATHGRSPRRILQCNLWHNPRRYIYIYICTHIYIAQSMAQCMGSPMAQPLAELLDGASPVRHNVVELTVWGPGRQTSKAFVFGQPSFASP